MTGAGTIAAAITDAAHILARALESPEWREDARSGPDAPGPVQTDPEGTGSAESVAERAVEVMADLAPVGTDDLTDRPSFHDLLARYVARHACEVHAETADCPHLAPTWDDAADFPSSLTGDADD